MKKVSFIGYILLNLITIFSEATHVDSGPTSSDSSNETPSKIMVRYRGNRGVGYNRGYTTVAAFLTPNWSSNFHPYADLRGHWMNDKKFAANVGLGARGTPTEGFGMGANVFFDYRHLIDMSCYQLGSGIELLSPYLDFRLNGYLPISRKTHTYIPHFEKFQGNTITVKQTTKGALPSITAEFGLWIPKLPETIQVYLAAGPYYLGSREMKSPILPLTKVGNICGGKCRLNARILNYVDAGIEYTYDSLFHTRFQGYLSVSLPLGPSKAYGIFKKGGYKQLQNAARKFKRQMLQPVDRNEIVPIYQKVGHFTPDAKLLFVDENAPEAGDGTFEKPFRSLRRTRSVPNDGVIVLSDDKKDEDLEKDNDFVFVVPPPEKPNNDSPKRAKRSTKDRLDEVEGGYITKRLRLWLKEFKEDWNDMW